MSLLVVYVRLIVAAYETEVKSAAKSNMGAAMTSNFSKKKVGCESNLHD
jgi:hypothetical protein